MKNIIKGHYYYHKALDMVVVVTQVIPDLTSSPKHTLAVVSDPLTEESIMADWTELEDIPQEIYKLLYEQDNPVPPQK